MINSVIPSKYLSFTYFSKKTDNPNMTNRRISFLPIISEFITGYKKKPGDKNIKISIFEFSKYFTDLIKTIVSIRYKSETKLKTKISSSNDKKF